MYEEFYGFKMKPFQMTPDPAFLYWSDAHQMAFTMLNYGILNASPMTVITGDVGAGKTTLLRHLLNEFPSGMKVGLISNLMNGKGDLLAWVLMAFEQPHDGGPVDQFKRFQDFVVETYASGKHVVLIVDEAQNLGIEQLEELRMLSNMNAERDQLLQIILVGQPELREMLNRPELRQFSQRITSDFHLRPLDEAEVRSYIQHRLAVAGIPADREIFPRKICDLIAHATEGVPRLINTLCDLCLACGFSLNRDVIDEDILRELAGGIERAGIFNQLKSISGAPTLVENEEDEAKVTGIGPKESADR
jgi:type II secretory pathway predicted ATPase ExeA